MRNTRETVEKLQGNNRESGDKHCRNTVESFKTVHAQYRNNYINVIETKQKHFKNTTPRLQEHNRKT